MMHIMADADGIISLPSAWKWIKDRKFTIKKEWTPWLTKDLQLVGYVKEYEQNFTFVTLNGQGHSGVLERLDAMPDLILNYVNEQPLLK
jgi:Serine carboxypeptidase